MTKFPRDAPIKKVLRAFRELGFVVIRTGNQISLEKANPDGTKTPMTIPYHPTLKSSTLRTILTQAEISRDKFLKVYK